MEYAFSVGTRFSNGERVLTAEEYYEGHLDWYALDVNAGVTLGAATDNAFTEITRTAIPAPVSFRGMASARFWEFEDAQVDFGSVNAGADGSVAYAVGRSGFTAPASNLFFLPPTLLKSLESRPIEEALFLRDEMANLTWAVERLVESPAERPLNRFEAYLEQKHQREQESPPQPMTTPETLRYRLMTEIPDYWIPLMPVRVGPGLRLKRGAMLKTDGSREPVQSLGRILESGHELSLFEEELPREGIRVTRSYQFTRWIDGSSHFWVGRRKGVGRGEGSGGLQFDSLDGKDWPDYPARHCSKQAYKPVSIPGRPLVRALGAALPSSGSRILRRELGREMIAYHA